MPTHDQPKVINTIYLALQFLIAFMFFSNLVLIVLHGRPLVAEFFSIGPGAFLVFLLLFTFFLLILCEGIRYRSNVIKKIIVFILLFNLFIFCLLFSKSDFHMNEMRLWLRLIEVAFGVIIVFLLYLPSSRRWFKG
jgi:hypothetical protein